MTVMQFGAIVGPLMAGVMLHWMDLSTLYLIDAITCVAAIWATFRLSPMPPSDGGRGTPGWGFTAVLDGFRYLAGDRVVLMSFVVDLIAMIFGHAAGAVPANGAREFRGADRGRHHDGPAGRGDVSRCGGGRPVLRLAAAGSAAGPGGSGLDRGLAMVGFGLAGGFADGYAGLFLWISLACLAVGGAADMVSAAFRSTILQQAASDDLRGRLQGVFTVVVAGGPRLADAVHGAAAAAVGTTVAAAGGGALVVIGVVVSALLVPAFIRYRVADDDKV